MTDIKNDIIKERLFKLDTAAVSDAMDSLEINRALPEISSRVEGVKIAGPVFTVQYEPYSTEPSKFQNAGNYIDDVPANHVILINNDGNTECTNWGDILTRKAIAKKIEGTIINGSARDISLISELGYPLFSKGIYMVSGKNRVRIKATNISVNIAGVIIDPGDWVFADDNGVVILPYKDILTIITRAENVNETELKIIKAIESGSSLELARSNFGYASPWIGKNGE